MNTQHYISTRGGVAAAGFREAVLSGLARDGGLLIPTAIPYVRDRLECWAKLSYQALAVEILRLYGDLPEDELAGQVTRAYATFRDPEVAPVRPLGPVHILELFHGPTLAFKDVALQWLGHLFSHLLEQSGGHMNILAATSGDTGSAAIAGMRGRPRIRIFVMHPRGRVSPTQERQMTTVLDANVHNLAVAGSFDDCQRIMKTLFADLAFKDRYALGAVNSVNWARVLSQIVYYFYAAFRVQRATGARAVQFAVPTGNFGDVLAGWYAAQMGLPIKRLILATNENDILARFFRTGDYRYGAVVPTLSPSMDIQVASNFERYLYHRVGSDAARLRALMQTFDATGALSVPPDAQGRVDELFAAGVGATADTLATIRRYDAQHGYLLDPHTAVGVHVAEQHLDADAPTICLATAHPAKFSAAIREATGRDAAHHPLLDRLADLPTRCADVPADPGAVRTFIAEQAAD